jgi:hypothetical protein
VRTTLTDGSKYSSHGQIGGSTFYLAEIQTAHACKAFFAYAKHKNAKCPETGTSVCKTM